ncbi:diacylglycerol kinase family protein [Nesterenkonia muleiensis]|uniref:diacylglycerol kinase family protein n=1 Tax=Nesterenkonia muleiensis TaxID=2282648 RepID=UPI000E750256|nr:diacylglycerol kinase family protein [Nesterenkonia muleiensis]
MTEEGYWWVIAVGLGLAVGLLVVILRLGRRVRALKRQVTELEQRAEVTASVAAHPKLPVDRLIGVVVNASKENADQAVALVRQACERAGMPAPLIEPTTPEDSGLSMTDRAVEAGCDVVIAAGGDGTLRAVAARLVGTEVAMGIVPLGTGNLFARNIGLPYQDLAACASEAIHGAPHPVDTLDLRLQRSGGRTDQEISLVIAGGGLDAEVMADTREVLKARAGWLAYGEAGLRHVLGARKTVGVKLDDADPETFRVRSVLLANCGTLQAGIRLIPEAMFDDGHMDVALFTPRHALDWARVVSKTVLRFSADIPVMKVRQARVARLTMAGPMPFQIDGDAVGEVVSVSAQVDPGSLVVNGVSPSVLEHPES